MDRRLFLRGLLGFAAAAAVTGVASVEANAAPRVDPDVRKDDQAAQAGPAAPDGTPAQQAQYYYRRRRYFVRRRFYYRPRYRFYRRRYY